MELPFAGLLFDLDGTLVDSSAVIDRAWTAFANKHDLDPEIVLREIQGKPAAESIKALLPAASVENILRDTQWLERMESQDTDGVFALAGSIELLVSLNRHSIPWAIVTSGTVPVATARIAAAGLPTPDVLVTPEQLSKGKPDPEPYLLGASKIGLVAKECIVFEDAQAGVMSGVSASAQVIGILTQLDRDELQAAGAVECIESLAEVDFSPSYSKWILSLR